MMLIFRIQKAVNVPYLYIGYLSNINISSKSAYSAIQSLQYATINMVIMVYTNIQDNNNLFSVSNRLVGWFIF